MTTHRTDFTSIRISLASPEQVQSWSYGEVTKPETINYRTLRPEKDGLFCERIFGPTKDWECFCGKYKKIRYKGVICDRCGVEVARAKVRRERMAHIRLATPVAHIWFAKGTPSRLGLLLDLSPRNLDRVLYFAQYIITSVNEEVRKQKIEQAQAEHEEALALLEQETEVSLAESRLRFEAEEEGSKAKKEAKQSIDLLEGQLRSEKKRLGKELQESIDELEDLCVNQLVTENRYREFRDRWGYDVFKASMGAESVLEILRTVDLDALRESLHIEVRSTSGQRRKKAIKRLRVVESLRKSENKVEWMILTLLPVLPPDLRPMVQLDGGRFATSDLNDLYRRVINRNNRLKRLLDLGAPEIIVRNEKRMLQEAVDALMDNGRRGRAISGSHNHKLKSLSDLLRGKQGRFRQNLLGKRVDYSGRSVIVVGPELKLYQCGLPKRMALELFKPFVMNRLVLEGHAHNIKSAKRMVERVRPEVWDILEDVIKRRPVMLNRAPTLHRLGIQAFLPVLIEGSAIQIHPMVCTAFNADFDGDQMAVHVPLSAGAVHEAKSIMLSTNNMLSPSSGDPVVAPTLDIVLGCYYLTMDAPGSTGEGSRFSSHEEALLAYESGAVALQARVFVLDKDEESKWIETTPGILIFNEVIPPEMGLRNLRMDKSALKDLIADCYRLLGNERTATVLDSIKELGFHYATQAGITIAINDIEVPKKKEALLANSNQEIAQLEEQFQLGLITEEERYNRAVSIWTAASELMTGLIEETLPSYGGIYMMVASGAKGNIAQIKQMAGMRGLMSNPRGRIIDLPIRSSFREGLSVLEYFISTHGARKGLTDTALRTADSGYLTRRLIDVSQEVIVLEEDCGTMEGFYLQNRPEYTMLAPFENRILGRFAASPQANPSTGEVLVGMSEEIDETKATAIVAAGIDRVHVRSPLTCEARHGICRLCYGRSLATEKLILMGEAVGIIAAQSIGEPGTQLTMRTFHTGGVAGADITSGLPRVEELFEARVPKGMAILAEIDGTAHLEDGIDGRRIRIVSEETYQEDYTLPKGYVLAVKTGDWVDVGTTLAKPAPAKGKGKKKEAEGETDLDQPKGVIAHISGQVLTGKTNISITWVEPEQREYIIPSAARIMVADNATVQAGSPLTTGPLSPQDILRVLGKEEVQRYLVAEVQNVYHSQGITINDKHIEVITRQMLRKVKVDSPGDTELLPGQLVDKFSFEETNARILAEGGEPATASPLLLGITRASLNTESFLAAASFQETTRVLTEAAVNGAVDHLRGLKENVIIGRLIPARLDISQEGRDALGLPDPNDTLPMFSSLEKPSNDVDTLFSEELVGSSTDSPNTDSGSEALNISGLDITADDNVLPENSSSGETNSPEEGSDGINS
jgi:DNA-directed RNA polymerase subunit beta'